MLQASTINNLYDVILAVATNEAKVEALRQRICSHYPEEVFLPRLIFDKLISPDDEEQPMKFANASDLISFITKQEIEDGSLHEQDFAPLFDIFDFNDDGYLDFEDFILFILPQDEPKVR